MLNYNSARIQGNDHHRTSSTSCQKRTLRHDHRDSWLRHIYPTKSSTCCSPLTTSNMCWRTMNEARKVSPVTSTILHHQIGEAGNVEAKAVRQGVKAQHPLLKEFLDRDIDVTLHVSLNFSLTNNSPYCHRAVLPPNSRKSQGQQPTSM